MINANEKIYLDYAETTPLNEEVSAEMSKCKISEEAFVNSASGSNQSYFDAKNLIEESRNKVAKVLGVDGRTIVWTSGATESNDLAIKSVANFKGEFVFAKGKVPRIITTKIEHKSVLDSCRQLERQGFDVIYINPDSNGVVRFKDIEPFINDSTILVSVMYANHETGSISDIDLIGRALRKLNITFHVDAAQAFAKVKIDPESYCIDLMSISAHKIYGPKGVGALYVGRKSNHDLSAQSHSCGYEDLMHSDTPPTHKIVGFAKAAEVSHRWMQNDNIKFSRLRTRFLNGLKDIVPYQINGSTVTRYMPGIINISFKHVEGESLLIKLNEFVISNGSKCTSSSLEPSHVLKALGLDDVTAKNAIRFSLGKYTTEVNIDELIASIITNVKALQELSPLLADLESSAGHSAS